MSEYPEYPPIPSGREKTEKEIVYELRRVNQTLEQILQMLREALVLNLRSRGY